MKKILLLIFLIFPLLCMGQRIAVLEFKPGVGVTLSDVDGLSSIFVTYFHPQNYTLVERSEIDRVIDEQQFQRSSLTERQMVKIGELLNLSKLVVGNINVIMGEYNVDVRVINVESGTIVATEGTAFTQGSYREGMKNLAINLAAKLSSKQETHNTVLRENTGQSKIYTKADLLKKGFKFHNDLPPQATVDGINGPVLIQAFLGSQTSYDKSWYISGDNLDGKLNGLMILFANGGSENSFPEIYISYVCDGELAYPLMILYKAYGYEEINRAISIQEPYCRYCEYTTFWKEWPYTNWGNGFIHRSMFTELMKIYGHEIYSKEFLFQGSEGNFDIKKLRNNFDLFMQSDNYISPVAWTVINRP